MLSWRSVKRSQDKGLRIAGIEHIKARPVVVGQVLRNDLDDELCKDASAFADAANALTLERI